MSVHIFDREDLQYEPYLMSGGADDWVVFKTTQTFVDCHLAQTYLCSHSAAFPACVFAAFNVPQKIFRCR